MREEGDEMTVKEEKNGRMELRKKRELESGLADREGNTEGFRHHTSHGYFPRFSLHREKERLIQPPMDVCLLTNHSLALLPRLHKPGHYSPYTSRISKEFSYTRLL